MFSYLEVEAHMILYYFLDCRRNALFLLGHC